MEHDDPTMFPDVPQGSARTAGSVRSFRDEIAVRHVRDDIVDFLIAAREEAAVALSRGSALPIGDSVQAEGVTYGDLRRWARSLILIDPQPPGREPMGRDDDPDNPRSCAESSLTAWGLHLIREREDVESQNPASGSASNAQAVGGR